MGLAGQQVVIRSEQTGDLPVDRQLEPEDLDKNDIRPTWT